MEELPCSAEKGIGICTDELNEIGLAAGLGFLEQTAQMSLNGLGRNTKYQHGRTIPLAANRRRNLLWCTTGLMVW